MELTATTTNFAPFALMVITLSASTERNAILIISVIPVILNLDYSGLLCAWRLYPAKSCHFAGSGNYCQRGKMPAARCLKRVSGERRWWESNPRWRICNPLP